MTTGARPLRELVAGLVRYGLVGLANAATYYGTYLLAHPRAGYLVAHVVGLGTAMVVSFLLNCRFTFRVRGRRDLARHHARGAAVFVLTLALSNGALGVLHGARRADGEGRIHVRHPSR